MLFVCLLGIAWGRILNQIAYLLIRDYAPITSCASCPYCQYTYVWHHRIPILSYVVSRGRCQQCSATLPPYNFFVELLTGFTLCSLWLSSPASTYFPAYFLFFSALLVTIRTDLETLLIARLCTIHLIPIALLLSAVDLLPLSFFESMFGAALGYLLLYGMMHFFTRLTGKQGMGLGDLDLLACIGAFTGPSGAWISLLIGSTCGSIAGCVMMLIMKRSKEEPLPFGPFLALGAMIYVLWQQQLLAMLFSV
ncbi:prepilin peptidase [Candidatus Dependentiae bacterium]|nr:prepilin peptidase [Candidatus Dependentiae bacterium]